MGTAAKVGNTVSKAGNSFSHSIFNPFRNPKDYKKLEKNKRPKDRKLEMDRKALLNEMLGLVNTAAKVGNTVSKAGNSFSHSIFNPFRNPKDYKKLEKNKKAKDRKLEMDRKALLSEMLGLVNTAAK